MLTPERRCHRQSQKRELAQEQDQVRTGALAQQSELWLVSQAFEATDD
jgi:hypothetical protein